MGLLDALLGGYTGGGMVGAPSSWQYPTSAPDASEEKKKQDAAFLGGINQDPNVGGFNPGQPGGTFPSSAPALAGTNGGIFGGSTPFGLGGINLPAQSQGAPASGAFPAVPFMPPQQAAAPQAAAPAPQQATQPPQQIAPQDSPTSVMNIGGPGGYQMPQFGTAPQPPSTDISAQSRALAPDQPLPPAFGGGGYLDRLHNGGSLIGSLFQNGTPQQQNLKAQFEATRDALIANGVPSAQAHSTAMLAVLNPEAAKTVLPELLSNKQELVKLKGPFGEEIPKVYSKTEHTLTDPEGYQAQNGGPVSAITDKIISARNGGATKDQLLAFVPPAYRDDLSALTSYKALPASMGRSEVRGQLVAMAHAIDPNFDESLIPTRIQMRKDFAGEGKNGQAIGAFNTVQHHAGQVSDAIEEFEKAGGGSNVPLWNAAKLALANNTGSNPQLRDAAQKLQDKLNATEHEVASAYNAGHITDSDRKTWNEIKASNLPTNQLRQKLDDFTELLNGKRDSLNHMYQQTFHEDAPTIDKESNAAITAKIHNRLPGYAKESSAGLPSGWSVKVR